MANNSNLKVIKEKVRAERKFKRTASKGAKQMVRKMVKSE
jgi:hypothetical protein